MTPTQLDAKSDALEALRASWEAKLAVAVADKVGHAHSHAYKALTAALKATADGRTSLLRINKSPSYQAAVARLDELWADLAGPSEVATEGAVRDAREAFLGLASKLWFPLIPEDVRGRTTPKPTLAEVRAIRAAAVHGYDPRKQLQAPVLSAKTSLKAALEKAGRASTPGHVEDDLLAAWQTRAVGSLTQAVRTLLNDSVEYADREAGRALIDPARLGTPGDEIPEG